MEVGDGNAALRAYSGGGVAEYTAALRGASAVTRLVVTVMQMQTVQRRCVPHCFGVESSADNPSAGYAAVAALIRAARNTPEGLAMHGLVVGKLQRALMHASPEGAPTVEEFMRRVERSKYSTAAVAEPFFNVVNMLRKDPRDQRDYSTQCFNELTEVVKLLLEAC